MKIYGIESHVYDSDDGGYNNDLDYTSLSTDRAAVAREVKRRNRKKWKAAQGWIPDLSFDDFMVQAARQWDSFVLVELEVSDV